MSFPYEPVPKTEQEKAWNYAINWTCTEKEETLQQVIKGGLGSGKSYISDNIFVLFILKLIIWVQNNCQRHNGFFYYNKIKFDTLNFIVIGRTVEETRETQFNEIVKTLKMLGLTEGVQFKYKLTPATITIFEKEIDKPTIKLISKTAEQPKAISGNNVCGIWADEIFLFSDEDVFKRLTGRLRFGGKGFPKILLYSGTPEPNDTSKGKFIKNMKTFTMPTIENATNLGDKYIENLKNVYTKEELRCYLYGEEIILKSGMVYYSFSENNISSDENDLKINPYTPLMVGVDFNVNPYCSFIGQQFGDKIIIQRGIELKNANTLDMIAEIEAIRVRVQHQADVYVYPDSNSGRQTGQIFKNYSADYSMFEDAGYYVFRLEQNPSLRVRTSATNVLFEKNKVQICKHKSLEMLLEDIKRAKWHEKNRGEFSIKKHRLDAMDYMLFLEIGMSIINQRNNF